MNIAPQTLVQAQELLKSLKIYEDMKKKLWKRGVALFHQKLNNTHLCKVEYHSSLWESEALIQAQSLYKRIFFYEASRSEILLVENDLLWWGMKIFFDDALLDMSFQRVERTLQK